MTTQSPVRKVFHFPALMIGIGSVISGTAAANFRGNAEVLPATLCLIFAIFFQLASISLYLYNVLKRTIDWKDLNIKSEIRSEREEATRLTARETYYKVFTIGFLFMAIIAGCGMVSMGGYMMLLIGIFILVAGWFMMSGKYPLIDTPWGPLFTFLVFGPAAVITTSLLQSQHEAKQILNWFDIAPSLYMSFAVGFLAAIANLVTNFVRLDYDTRAHNETFLITFGSLTTRKMIVLCAFLCAGTLIFSCFGLNYEHPLLILIPVLIPLAVNLWIAHALRTRSSRKLEIVEYISYGNVTLLGILSLIISFFDGVPDDSKLIFFN